MRPDEEVENQLSDILPAQQQAQSTGPRITTRYMTKYERARILGTRALQIRWAPVLVSGREAAGKPQGSGTVDLELARVPSGVTPRAEAPSRITETNRIQLVHIGMNCSTPGPCLAVRVGEVADLPAQSQRGMRVEAWAARPRTPLLCAEQRLLPSMQVESNPAAIHAVSLCPACAA
jgi:DNA-directed RNA polymerase subunit K/omega